MQRILHIIDSLDYTGTAAQLLLLAKGLVERGFEVHVCALDRQAPRAAEFHAAGIATTVISRRSEIDPFADLHLARTVSRLRPDLVHTWDSVAGMLAPSVLQLPHVAGVYRKEAWQPTWDWFWQRRFAPSASQFVSNSEIVRGWAVRQGLPAERFDVIPSAVEPARPSDVSRDELLDELELPADAKLIGVVGQLVPPKRVKDLIWAADLLRVLHDNLRLLVIGDGPLRVSLEEYARLASDLDHIRFLGSRSDLWRILPHLDVLWNGSENTAQSAAILEAMAAGVPVIATDTPTNRELVADDETGFLIPYGVRSGRADRARLTDRIFTNPQFAARIVAAASERVAAEHNTESMLYTYLERYARAIGNPTGSAPRLVSAPS